MKNAKIQYAIAVCLFGTTGVILRWTILPSEIMVMCRGLLGAALIYAFLRFRRENISFDAIRKNLAWLIFGGVALGLNWVFLFAAYRYSSVALASLCNYTAPILVVFLSPLLFRERLTAAKIGCILLSALGIVLISGVFSGGQQVDIPGLLLGMGAALGFVGIIVGNKNLQDISPYDRVIVQLLISSLTALPYVLWQNWGTAIPCNAASVFWMLVLAVVHTAFAYCCYFRGMGELPVQTIAVWGYMEPVVSILCSAWILAEPLDAFGVVGAACILGSALFSELMQSRG